MKRSIHIILVFLIITVSSQAGLIINEVMVNEPGNSTTLEWIEIYNNSAAPISFAPYSIDYTNMILIKLPDTVTLDPGKYFIVCRKLFGDASTPGFESRWGDSSGVWGDTEFEATMFTPYEVTFTLKNTGGSVVLLENSSGVSAIFWSSAGLDGYSFERVMPDSDEILQSIASSGSTPGKINSVMPLPYDIGLDSVIVSSNDGNGSHYVYVSNQGLNLMSNAWLYLSLNHYTSLELLDSIAIPPIGPGETVYLEYPGNFTGYYIDLVANLNGDQRSSNDTLNFVGIGSDFPPVIISELLANPEVGLSTEWIELKNISDITIDLSQWSFGDALSLKPIGNLNVMLGAGEYIVLAESETDFLNFYFGYPYPVVEPPGWTVYNNNNDLVRLVDRFGIEADRFVYDHTFDNHFTWARSEETEAWGRSANAFGTPGEYNEVFLMPTSSDLLVDIVPKHITPDGDGFSDEAEIFVISPEADFLSVKIYDRQGRVVKTFYDKERAVPAEIRFVWDGRSDGGNRLPVGLYIVFVEAGGVSNIKETVVIAR